MHSRDPSGQYYRRNRFYGAGSGRFTQEDPIGIAGGLNVYGYANGDPVSYSDPYGLSCEPKPACEKDGPIISFALSGAYAFGLGLNVEFGIAVNMRTLSWAHYARGGATLGLGASAGGEVAVQPGSLADFKGTNDVRGFPGLQNASELEIGAGLGGINIVLDQSAKPIGGGLNVGIGGGVLWNTTGGTWMSAVQPDAIRQATQQPSQPPPRACPSNRTCFAPD